MKMGYEKYLQTQQV